MKICFLLVKQVSVDYEGTETIPLRVSHNVETLKGVINTEWEEFHSGWISPEEEIDDGFASIRYEISEITLI